MPRARLFIVLALSLMSRSAAGSGFDPWRIEAVSPASDDTPVVAAGGSVLDPWRPEAFASFAWGDEGEVVGLHVGAERWLDQDESIAVVPQLTLGIAQNTDDDRPLLTGFDLQFRWYHWEVRGWDVFFEAGAGLQYVGPESLPRRGTHANFRLRGGIGGRYTVDDQLDIIAGLNWLHMSNANLLPGNNGHDGPMIYFGLQKDF